MEQTTKKYFDLKKAMNKLRKKNKLTMSQLEIVLCIGEKSREQNSNGINVGNISYIGVSEPFVSREVSKLWRKNFVFKNPTEDQRERKIVLTEKGYCIYQQAWKILDEYL
ncbi:hypothetical protein KAT80_03485 [Candidatus Pacearchaeota archaeon]|nr:hypothetical protein [Candidatus Pacearchaeota archaeon]